MQEITNTTCSVLRGTSVDAWGNQQDAGVPYMQGVPAFLAETSRTAYDRASQTPRTVRTTTCVLPDYVGVSTSDQITDESTGYRYAIEDILAPPTLMGAPADVVLTLRRVTAATA
jgi:hypothetical protein